MSRAALVVTLALTAFTLPAQGNFNCDGAYQGFWEQLNRRTPGNMSRERLANLRRWAQRAYDACRTGDVENPKALFERLDRESY